LPLDKEEVDCAIVGYGRIGRLYRRVIEGGNTGLRVTHIVDPKASDSRLEDVLKSNVRAILIATPPATHFEIANLALLSGKHVLVEKPPASTALECERLMRNAADAGIVLFFAYHARYNRAVLISRHQLSTAAIEHINVRFCEDVYRYHDAASWVFRQGVLRDSGINALSVVLDLMRGLDFVPQAASGVYDPESGALVRVNVDFSFGQAHNGTLHLDWTWKGSEVRELTFCGEGVPYTLDLARGEAYKGGQLIESDFQGGRLLEGEYTELLKHFHRCVQTITSSASSGEVRFLEAVEQSL
jgi:D-galactose 1-dehydrogenase